MTGQPPDGSANGSVLPSAADDTPILTADELRRRMTEIYREQRPMFEAYQEYGERMQALSIEYHHKRLSETFGLPVEVCPVGVEMNGLQSPKSLDKALSDLDEQKSKIKRILFDPLRNRFLLIA